MSTLLSILKPLVVFMTVICGSSFRIVICLSGFSDVYKRQISLCYGEQDYQYFLYTILLNTLVGGVLLICSRGAENLSLIHILPITTSAVLFFFSAISLCVKNSFIL